MLTKLVAKYFHIVKNTKILFLLFGAINTIVGYLNSVIVYYFFKEDFSILTLIIFINIFNISFSFLTMKYFVFKSKGKIINEYLRSMLVYSGLFIVNSLAILTFYEIYKINFYLASFLATIFGVILSYYGNKKITFKKI